MSDTHYYNVRRPSGKDRSWEALFTSNCRKLKINYERRHKKGVVSFDISCPREAYLELMRLMEE